MRTDKERDDGIARILREQGPRAAVTLDVMGVTLDEFRDYAVRNMGILSSVRHQVLAELMFIDDDAKGPAMAGAVAWKPGDRR